MIDAEIKYPQLCELCTSKTSKCEYEEYKNRHIEALNCLLDKGEVAYVSSQDAVDFFSPVSQSFTIVLFKFLH